MRIADLFILQNIWRWLQRSQSFIVLITSLALTYYFWQDSAQQVTNEASAYFEFQVQQTQIRIEERMRACEQILHGASGLFAASKEVSREEFRAYINSLLLQENYPGIQGVGFSLIIPSPQLATHEAAIRNQGFPNYVVKPPGTRQVYTSIIYLEPFADRNLRAFGYDMFSEPVRRAAMERARDTGLPALSGKVVLMQEQDTTVQAGTLLYVPVYKNGHSTITVEERRANIIGWVYSPYRMTDLMSGVLGQQLNADFGVGLFDGSQINAPSLLYQSVHTDNPKQQPTFYKTTVLHIAGQQWTMMMHTLPGFGQNLQLSKPYIVANAGIIASLLLFVLTWQLAHGLELALKIIKQRETQFKTLFDHSLDAVLLASPDGKVLAANPAATKLFGYTETELQTLGRPAIVKMSDPRLPDFLARRNCDGFTRGELTLKCKDGSTFEGEVSSSIFTGADTQVQSSIIVHDITERKQIENALQESEARWKFALEGSGDGVWDWNAETNQVFFSRQWKAMLGYAADEIGNTLDEWDKRVHPDDKDQCYVKLQQHFAGATSIYQSEHRILCKNGTYKWIFDRGKVIEWIDQGKPRRVIGTHSDITERKRVEELRAESEARFRLMANSAPVLIWIAGPDKLCFWFNKVWLDFTGRSLEQEIGNGWTEGVHPDDLQHCLDTYINCFERRQAFTMEYRLKHHSGEYRWITDNGVPRFTNDGDFAGYIGSCIDITERKQMEAALRASEGMLRTIYDLLPIGLSITDPHGHIIDCNNASETLLGVTKAEHLKLDYVGKEWNIIRPDGSPMPVAEYASVRAMTEQRLMRDVEMGIVKPTGTTWISVSAIPSTHPDYGVIIAYIDITQSKQAEQQLQNSERHFQRIVDTVPAMLYDYILYPDGSSKFLYVSKNCYDILELDDKELITDMNLFWKMVHQDDIKRIREEDVATNRTGRIFNIEIRIITKSGRMKWVQLSSRPNPATPGELAIWSGYILDITWRKQAELELYQAKQSAEAAKQFAHETIDALSAHLCVLDATGNIILINRAWREFADANGLTMENYGIGRNYLQACKSVTDNANHCLADNFCNQLNSLLKGEIIAFQFEYPCHSPTEKRWFNAHVSRFSQAPLRIVIAHENITDRKLAEEKTKASEERMRAIIAAEPECIKILDHKGILLDMNPAGLAMIEADSLDQVIGQSIFKVIAREYRKDYIALHQRVMMGESQEMEYEVLGLKGSRRWLETHAVRVQDNGQWLHLAITRDISHRKQAETALIKARQDAEAANIAKSAFLANMSHEIRTPMNSILGMAQMLLQPDIKSYQYQKYAQIIFNSGRLLLALLNDILDLSKVEAGKIKLELTPCQPKQILNEISLLFAENTKRKSLQFNCNWNGPARYYLSDPYRLQQMLSNLVTNAIKFTESGQIDVAGTEIECNGSTAILEFSVTDTGIGIAPNILRLLFAPFTQADSSTTRRFGGTGLGLSIVKSLAKNMGGNAGCTSELGQGSRFWFRIHADIVVINEIVTEQNLPQVSIPEQFHGRILVAEDDLANTEVIQAMLHQLGLTVKTVNDGQQAIDAIIAGDAANIIIMDVHMPIIDGCAATQQIRQWEKKTATPRHPIIALTASVFESNRQQCLSVGMDGFLTKPVVFDELKQVLNQWLDAKTVEKPNTATPVLPATVKPVNVPQVVAILRELIPALTQNSFHALRIFNNLSEVLVDTDLATEIELMAKSLAQLQFHLVLTQLRQIMANRGWKQEML